jgi:hypothetical protein
MLLLLLLWRRPLQRLQRAARCLLLLLGLQPV